MWRVALWHPLVVHFPIALLLVGTLLRLIGAFVSSVSFTKPAGRTLLVLGVVGAWVAIYTGTQAYYAVVRTLCDPTVADSHARFAYWTAYLFTAGLFLDGLLWFDLLPGAYDSILNGLLCVTLLTGSAYLGYAGHLGSRLVYQQAAAVHQPTPHCQEFM